LPSTNEWHTTWNRTPTNRRDGVRSYSYDQTNRLTQVTEGSLTTQFAYNGDGVRTSKTVAGDTTEYVVDLAATLPVVAVHCPPDESSGSPGLCMAWARLGFTP
jgi:YD repeat-containing protein